MIKTGIALRKLSLHGPSVPEARIDFDSAFALAVGPSDTGKSYVLQCVDFVLGGGRLPKVIPEAAGYETARLEFLLHSSNAVGVLERSLRGGGLQLSLPDAPIRSLRAKHDSSGDQSVSAFLLRTFGVDKKRVRVNARGTTHNVTFRDFARLAIVDEEAMFAEHSPAWSGQNNKATSDESVFRFILTGIDDSSVIEQPKPDIVRAGYRAQDELLSTLETELLKQASPSAPPMDQVEEELKRVAEEMNATLLIVGADQASLAVAERDRRLAWKEWRQLETRRGVLEGLITRFQLLAHHYNSDIRRLEAIAEADYMLAQYPDESCPVCGAPPDCQPHRSPPSAAFQEGCIAEARKLRGLADDLKGALDGATSELGEIKTKLENARRILDGKAAVLASELEPKARASADLLRALQERRDRLTHAADVARQLVALGARRNTIAAARKAARAEDTEELPSGVPSHDVERFCGAVEAILRAWEFPGLTRVTFSDAAFDIVVSGRARASHGKGVRAVLHAAFALGLMRFCFENDRPHPGFVILDSPLVAYREPKENDDPELGPAVKEAFYRTLASGVAVGQVLVLENEEPPPDLHSHAGIIRFTKASHGRYGFLPTSRALGSKL